MPGHTCRPGKGGGDTPDIQMTTRQDDSKPNPLKKQYPQRPNTFIMSESAKKSLKLSEILRKIVNFVFDCIPCIGKTSLIGEYD